MIQLNTSEFTKMEKAAGFESVERIRKDYSCYYFKNLHSIATQWEAIAPNDNHFLSSPYLQLLQRNPPQGMQFQYLLLFKNQNPIGIAYIQIQQYKASDNFDIPEDDRHCSLGEKVKVKLAKHIAFKVLICGNLLLTGEHGYYFKNNLSKKETIPILLEALSKAQQVLRRRKIETRALLLKDLYEYHHQSEGEIFKSHLSEFTIQPSMVLQLDPKWYTMEDYKMAISSKYRVRMKKAIKKGKVLRIVNFEKAELQEYQTEMYALYQMVAQKSDFNSATLHKNYILAVKEQYPKDFKVSAYFYENTLIGFHTTLKNSDELEAHFLGFDHSYNKQFDLYLNMLFNMLEEAITAKVKRLIYARTALEIKSSIGAKPIQMYCYARLHSGMANRLLKPMFSYLQTGTKDWKQRNPFKKN